MIEPWTGIRLHRSHIDQYSAVSALNYPLRPLRIIVGYAAGGVTNRAGT
jgi:tripartite-type tricarboxylate transporter receptor subunit TctC